MRRRERKGPRWRRIRALRSFLATVAGIRTVSLALLVLGVASAAVLLASPVDAAFPDDFLLRYSGLGAAPLDVPEVDCGSAFDAVGRDADASSLGTLARDAACREVASRRVAIALASGALIFVTGMSGLVLSSPRAEELRRR